MKLITAVIAPQDLDLVKQALKDARVTGMTVSAADGFGRRGGEVSTYRGARYEIDLQPRVRLEIVVAGREEVERIVNLLVANTRKGENGCGKAWVGDVDWVVSLRTGETNHVALAAPVEP